MSLIDKGDLQYDYTWTSQPGGSKSDKPDSNLFDREDGKEVLHIINEYAKEENITDKKRALEIETKLHQNLSQDVSTQRDVFDWLKANFGSDNDNS